MNEEKVTLKVNGEPVGELIDTTLRRGGAHSEDGTMTISRKNPDKLRWLFQDTTPNRRAVRAMKAWNRSKRKLTAAQNNHARRPPGTAHYFRQ